MKKLTEHRRLLVVAILLVIFLVTAISQIYLQTPKSETRKHVSLIVYGEDTERWENLRDGAALVCEEKNSGLSLLTTLSEEDVSEQIEIIDREIENGADALIIAPCSSQDIRDHIERKNPGIPVVFVEEVLSLDGSLSCITPDDYNMGHELGENLVENESGIVTVAVISDEPKKDSVSLREKGFLDAIEGKVGKLITWSDTDNRMGSDKRTFIQKALVSEATDVIVSFDNTTTDALIDALSNLNEERRIYSVSTSNKALYNLYSRKIITLAYPNEYAMGYLAAMNVLDRPYADKMYRDKEIEYRIVRKEDMYDEDNQTLLFPFVN